MVAAENLARDIQSVVETMMLIDRTHQRMAEFEERLAEFEQQTLRALFTARSDAARDLRTQLYIRVMRVWAVQMRVTQ